MRTQDEVSAMHCPVCRVPLSMSDRQGIEIDYCPQCRGVWLDRGELDKIVERSAAPAPQAPSRPDPRHDPRHEPRHDPRHERSAWGNQQGGHGHGHHGQHQGRRKSWLEDIFD